jgi:hypothetical protein
MAKWINPKRVARQKAKADAEAQNGNRLKASQRRHAEHAHRSIPMPKRDGGHHAPHA